MREAWNVGLWFDSFEFKREIPLKCNWLFDQNYIQKSSTSSQMEKVSMKALMQAEVEAKICAVQSCAVYVW